MGTWWQIIEYPIMFSFHDTFYHSFVTKSIHYSLCPWDDFLSKSIVIFLLSIPEWFLFRRRLEGRRRPPCIRFINCWPCGVETPCVPDPGMETCHIVIWDIYWHTHTLSSYHTITYISTHRHTFNHQTLIWFKCLPMATYKCLYI